MQLLKKFPLGLGFSISSFLLIALLLPVTHHVERPVVIKKPVSEVYSHVANLHNWAAWNLWTASWALILRKPFQLERGRREILKNI